MYLSALQQPTLRLLTNLTFGESHLTFLNPAQIIQMFSTAFKISGLPGCCLCIYIIGKMDNEFNFFIFDHDFILFRIGFHLIYILMIALELKNVSKYVYQFLNIKFGFCGLPSINYLPFACGSLFVYLSNINKGCSVLYKSLFFVLPNVYYKLNQQSTDSPNLNESENT